MIEFLKQLQHLVTAAFLKVTSFLCKTSPWRAVSCHRLCISLMFFASSFVHTELLTVWTLKVF